MKKLTKNQKDILLALEKGAVIKMTNFGRARAHIEEEGRPQKVSLGTLNSLSFQGHIKRVMGAQGYDFFVLTEMGQRALSR